MVRTIASRHILLAAGSVVLPVVVMAVYMTFAQSSASAYAGYAAFGVAIFTGIVCVWLGSARWTSRLIGSALYAAVMGFALWVFAVYFACYVLGDCI